MPDALRLHHIGHAVREIAPAVAQYTRRFGYAIVSPVFHDPLQTAFVQFLSLPGETSYLELAAPDGPTGKLANVARRGGGLHHLCYLAGPLAPAIADLEAAGMRLVSEPQPAVAFGGRSICWLLGEDQLLVELIERRDRHDLCIPGA